VHQVLMPLKQPNMYATAAGVRGGSDGVVECAVAGHLPAIADRLIAGARKHGGQTDDQALLLIRRLGQGRV
jgi:hypothetical protein